MKHSHKRTIGFLFIALLTFSYAAQAKDQWIQVRSKNFFLIGNASEKDIRKVGTRLEQFRETFRLLLTNANLTSPVPTNVVVFKSDSSYKQFKPKRSDGKIDQFVAGFFQSGEDVNYITLSTEGEDAETFKTIFHEYVHSIVNTNFGKSEVPTWFNEGLAEYYSTFAIEDDQKVKLGLPLSNHIEMLRQSQLMPLNSLFNVSNYQLLESGSHSRTIFYAESWAIIHYLLQTGKTEAMGKFLTLLMKETPAEQAFQDAFLVTYAQMESDLRKYIGKSTYQYNQFTFKAKLLFDAQMQASPLDEAAANTYLGDLLYHTQREDDAEPYLLSALKIQPDSSMTNTTLGMVKIKQRKFDEARKYLEVAIKDDQKNPMAFYRYAHLLSREGRDEFGYVTAFPKETADKMRVALRKAIALRPEFTESYELLAFVDLVNNEELDDAIAGLQKALRYQPGNQRYIMRIAEIMGRQRKYVEATAIAEKLAKTSDESDLKQRAENLMTELRQRQDFDARRTAQEKEYRDLTSGGTDRTPTLHRGVGEKPLTDAEVAKAQADSLLRSINQNIRNLRQGEQHIIGHIQKIDCKTRPLAFTIKTPTETFVLTSSDFQSLSLNVFVEGASDLQVGCDANISSLNAVITYRPATAAKSTSRGEIVAADFVGNDFRFLTADEMKAPPTRLTTPENAGPDLPEVTRIENRPSTLPAPADMDKMRRDMTMHFLKDQLQKPGEGEKREMGYLDKIECTNKSMFFHLRTATQTLRLINATPESFPPIRLFVQDLAGVRFGCTLKPIEFPAVFIYKDKQDAKTKTAGVIVSLDFVPKSFVLD